MENVRQRTGVYKRYLFSAEDIEVPRSTKKRWLEKNRQALHGGTVKVSSFVEVCKLGLGLSGAVWVKVCDVSENLITYVVQ